MVRLKWECTGTPTTFKGDYPIDYLMVGANGRRNRQRNTIIIVKLKKATEHAATEAEVDGGQLMFLVHSAKGAAIPAPPCVTGRGLTSTTDRS